MTEGQLDSIDQLPDGDVNLKVECVTGGWVGYLWCFPRGAAKRIFKMTELKPTRGEAVAALHQLIEDHKV